MRKTFLPILFLIACTLPYFSQAQTFNKVNQINSDGCAAQDYWELNGKLYFQATDGVNGQELWVTDGTNAGTHMVKDIFPGEPSSNPSPQAVYNNKLYFIAEDSVYGQEMWVTDGTDNGTHILKDINLSDDNGNYQNMVPPGYVTVYNNKMYFFANDHTHGYQLWGSDGTDAGTQMVIFIPADTTVVGNIGTTNSLTSPVIYNGYMYFTGSKGIQNVPNSDDGINLWKSDGTEAGTVEITTGLYIPDDFAYLNYNPIQIVNGKMIFEGSTNSSADPHGVELWTSDGTSAGTQMLKDIVPGPYSSNPSFPYAYNNKVYFQADDSAHGVELWVTDGTTAGTSIVADLYPGIDTSLGGSAVNSSYPEFFTGIGDKVYFMATTDAGKNLFSTDGTPSGTSRLTTFPCNINSGFIKNTITQYNNNLYFIGNQSNFIDYQLYRFNTVQNTYEKLVPQDASSTDALGGTGDFGVFNNNLYFQATYDYNDGNYLWNFNDNTAAVPQVPNNDHSLKVYPVPALDEVTLTTTDTKLIGTQVYITDVQGRLIKTCTITSANQPMNISQFADGMYILKTNDGGVYKIIKN